VNTGTPGIAGWTTLTYSLLGTGWILLSDVAVGPMASADEAPAFILMQKGTLFVALTAALLYLTLRRQQRSRAGMEGRLRQMAQAVEHSPVSVVIAKPSGAIEYVNPQFEQLTGYTLADVVGRTLAFQRADEASDTEYAAIHRRLLAGGEWHGDFCSRRKSGELYWEHIAFSAIKDDAGRVTGLMAVKQDITERRNRERRLRAIESICHAVRRSRTPEDTVRAVERQVAHWLHAADVRVVLAGAPASKPAVARIAQADEARYELRLSMMADHVRVGELVIHRRCPFDESDRDVLEAIADVAATACQRARLDAELTEAQDASIAGWSRALDLRDRAAEGHSRRVAELSVRLALQLGVSGAALQHLYRGALLHDIGKMAIPDAILLKPGPLTDQERRIVEQHPLHGHEMLAPITFLRPALEIPLSHHERWDGRGYPHRLAGEAIPLAARIFAVVDVWDALTSDRPYRQAWDETRAEDYLLAESGKSFDPRVVAAFFFVTQDVRVASRRAATPVRQAG
jgi:PAS domain S-box-containing protein